MVGLMTVWRLATHKVDFEANAEESYRFWRSVGYDHDGASAWCGNEQGETSFDPLAIGDHGHAFGPGQDHEDRCAVIKKNTGIDLMDRVHPASHLDMLRAVDWESSHAIGTRHVREHVMTASGIRAKVTVLVHEFERSGRQAVDIDKRTGYAEAIAEKFKGLLP